VRTPTATAAATESRNRRIKSRKERYYARRHANSWLRHCNSAIFGTWIRSGLNSQVVYISSKCLHTNCSQLKCILIFFAQLISEAVDQVSAVRVRDDTSDVRLQRSRVSGPVTSVSDVVLPDTESSDTATNSTELVQNDNYTGHLLDLFQQLM